MKTLSPLFLSIFLIIGAALVGCGSDVADQIDDAIDIADGVPERELQRAKLGVNAFFNEPAFGSIADQFNEIQSEVKLSRIRVLLAWDDNVQPSPSSEPNFSFYDNILNSIPSNVEALVILTNTPSWMGSPTNWTEGNPRLTFVRRWVSKVVQRYSANSRIIGWQIWNEPNQAGRPDNNNLQLTNSPTNFLELLSLAHDACKGANASKLVINGATTAINQNYPASIQYNRDLKDGGVTSIVDAFAVHYYGRQFENVVRSGGVAELLNSMGKPIWVTETGAQGISEQRKYARQVIPYLSEKIPAIDRFYIYQMFENSSPENTYGLRNPSSKSALSDLYLYLRDEL